MTIYKDFTLADIAKLRAGCDEWGYFPLEVGLDALKKIEDLQTKLDRYGKHEESCGCRGTSGLCSCGLIDSDECNILHPPNAKCQRGEKCPYGGKGRRAGKQV